MTKLRRFEILLPHKFNDGRSIPRTWFGEAIAELLEQFDGVSFERRSMQGKWRHAGVVYGDVLSRVLADVPDTPKNRAWMRKYQDRWRKRLEQIELRMVSYRIDVD